MREKTDFGKKNRSPRHLSRRPYYRRYSGVVRHLDWYIDKGLRQMPGERWPIEEIESALARETGIRISWNRIRRYNAQQFLEHEVAPLARISDSEYAINEHYYTLMGEYISEPGTAKRGRHRKRYTMK